jgi:hypothetical protein
MPYATGLYQTPTYYTTNNITTSNTTLQFVVWPQWSNTGTTLSTYYTDHVQQRYGGRRQDQENAWQAWREQDRERHQERQVARVRARTLLDDFLSDEQKLDLERHGHFIVIGSKGRRYRIRTRGQSGNVDLLAPNGEVQAMLCAHPRDYLPDGDAWLMQMIELRHDEDHFLATANIHRGQLPLAA